MLNIHSVTENCGGDPAILLELAVMFLEESARQLSAIEQAMSAGKSEEMQFAAHRLRGGLAIFGADSALQAAAAVEMIGLSKRMENAPDGVARLKTELAQTADDVRDLIARETIACSNSVR
jgi:HPt (histidine-containing phosphotransfer) domain-containing protein